MSTSDELREAVARAFVAATELRDGCTEGVREVRLDARAGIVIIQVDSSLILRRVALWTVLRPREAHVNKQKLARAPPNRSGQPRGRNCDIATQALQVAAQHDTTRRPDFRYNSAARSWICGAAGCKKSVRRAALKNRWGSGWAGWR
jgi:hypothetical protein